LYKSSFVGRSRELETLNALWTADKATLLILSGRRRVGKTRLLTHWLQQNPGSGLYWVAEPTSALTQLRSFSQALMAFVDPDSPIPADFAFTTWEQALSQLALFSQNRRIAIFIDEITYLIDVDPDFVGTLQKVWDHRLSKANVMLALSGSQMGMMKKHLVDYQAPLHGRATAQMLLPPLPFGATGEYFPDYSAFERVQIYAMWGGVPAYWERLDPKKSVTENLRQTVLPAHAWMVDESRILLQDFITDLHNYVGILRAVADGQQALSDISKRTGLTGSKISFYLSVLRDTGFVDRKVPISQRDTDSRKGRYCATDPYLRFFYKFLSAYQSKLALGQIQQMLELIEEEMPAFIEANTWQELCRDWVLLASANGDIPVPVEDVGSEWAGSSMLEVVGISGKYKSLVLGNCFWRDEPADIADLRAMIKKTSLIAQDDSAVYYTGFSANGWTEEAQREASAIAMAKGQHKWQTVGIRLLDLADVDADFARWSV
jgi:uncharacterized protein